MLIKKVTPLLSDGIKYNTTYLWSSDGWTYDSEKKIRRKYEELGNSIFEMTEEPYTKAVFSGVEYVEIIEVILISESPRIWIERGIDVLDRFEEMTEPPQMGDTL